MDNTQNHWYRQQNGGARGSWGGKKTKCVNYGVIKENWTLGAKHTHGVSSGCTPKTYIRLLTSVA